MDLFIAAMLIVLINRTDLIMDALDIPRLTFDKNWRPIVKPKSQRDQL